MLGASNAWARWGVAASVFFVAAAVQVGGAATASAQTAPTPAPNPLESLIPNLLAPLQPLLNPSPVPTAPAPGSAGNSNGGSSGSGGSGGGAPSPPIPKQVEVHCGGVIKLGMIC